MRESGHRAGSEPWMSRHTPPIAVISAQRASAPAVLFAAARASQCLCGGSAASADLHRLHHAAVVAGFCCWRCCWLCARRRARLVEEL